MVRKADGLKKSRPGQTSAGALTLVPDGTPFVGGAKAVQFLPARARQSIEEADECSATISMRGHPYVAVQIRRSLPQAV